MNSTFLGPPWSVWGVLCLLVAGIYMIVWPGRNASSAVPHRLVLPYIVLRWFHALVWVVLALSCFVRMSGLRGGPAVADTMGLVALCLYVIFIGTYVNERRLRR